MSKYQMSPYLKECVLMGKSRQFKHLRFPTKKTSKNINSLTTSLSSLIKFKQQDKENFSDHIQQPNEHDIRNSEEFKRMEQEIKQMEDLFVIQQTQFKQLERKLTKEVNFTTKEIFDLKLSLWQNNREIKVLQNELAAEQEFYQQYYQVCQNDEQQQQQDAEGQDKQNYFQDQSNEQQPQN